VVLYASNWLILPAVQANYSIPNDRILQPLWEFIKDGREDYLGSPLFPVFMSVTFYFVAVLPFMIIDLFGKEWHWVQRYKIQSSKEVYIIYSIMNSIIYNVIY